VETQDAVHRNEIRDGAQAWHWRPHSYKQFTHSQLKKNTVLEQDKTGFKCNKEILSYIHKGEHIQ